MIEYKGLGVETSINEEPTREEIIAAFAKPLFESLLDGGFIKLLKDVHNPDWKEQWRVEIVAGRSTEGKRIIKGSKLLPVVDYTDKYIKN